MARMPGANWRPIAVNHTPGGMGTIRGVVVHIMQGTLAGTDSWFRNKKAEASSHFGTGKTGSLYQWVSTSDKAWAQGSGNPSWISIENEGRSGEKLTDAQLDRCAEVLAWAHREHGVPLQVTSDPDGFGLGHHGMGGAAWGGHTACPGAPIVAQKAEIVRRAQLLAGEEGDVDVNDVWHKARVKRKKGTAQEREVSPAAFLQELEEEQDEIRKTLAKVLTKLDDLASKTSKSDADLIALIRSELLGGGLKPGEK